MAAEKPKYITVDQNFHARTSEGEIIIPLGFKTKLYRQVVAAGDSVMQLATVLDGLKLNKELDVVDELDLAEAGEVSEKYFAALGEHLGATLGE